MPLEIFYHYTTSNAADEIIRSNLLIRSTREGGGDAVFGDGVYLTKIPPSAGKVAIALNNWDGGSGRAAALIRLGKVNACIRLVLDTSRLKKAKDRNGRDVYLWPGDLQITPDMNAEGYFVPG